MKVKGFFHKYVIMKEKKYFYSHFDILQKSNLDTLTKNGYLIKLFPRGLINFI